MTFTEDDLQVVAIPADVLPLLRAAVTRDNIGYLDDDDRALVDRARHAVQSETALPLAELRIVIEDAIVAEWARWSSEMPETVDEVVAVMGRLPGLLALLLFRDQIGTTVTA
jgi:hypothetical protein